MKMLGGTIGGAIAGLVGAGIWTAVGYFTGYEVGWIAWGIGALVGVGVSLGMRGEGGAAGAVIAAVLSIGSVLLGKWAVISFGMSSYFGGEDFVIREIADVIVDDERQQGRNPIVRPEADTWQDTYPAGIWAQAKQRWDAMDRAAQQELLECPPLANDQLYLVYLADEIVGAYEALGKPVEWPDGFDIATARRDHHYPADVWEDAVRRWDEMTPQGQEMHRTSVRQDIQAGMEAAMSAAAGQGFKQSFGLFDILWLFLAVGTAAKLGAGGGSSETDAEAA